MKKKVTKAEWIKALRSGKYPQRAYYLLREDPTDKKKTYCCIGVYGELAGWDEENLIKGTNEIYHDAAEVAGCPISNLTDRNDGVCDFKNNQQTFNQIADFLESLP